MKERFIGISDGLLVFTNHQTSEIKKFQQHNLYSIFGNHLIVRNLEFNLYISVDLKKEFTKTDDFQEFEDKIIGETTELLITSIMEQILAADIDKIDPIMMHAEDKYWVEYRMIRKDYDNYRMKGILNYPSTEISPFINIADHLREEINRFINSIPVQNSHEKYGSIESILLNETEFQQSLKKIA